MVELGLVPLGAVAVVVLVGVSAFFSSSEIAVFTVRAERVSALAGEGDRRAARLASLLEDPHRLLVTILVGNNVVNVATTSIVTVLLVERLPRGEAAAAATVVASFVVLVFGEIVPKSYGLGNAEGWALDVARPLAAAQLALYPLVVGFDLLTRRAGSMLGGRPEIERAYEGEDGQ